MFGGPAGTRDLARRMGVDAIGIMSRDVVVGCRSARETSVSAKLWMHFPIPTGAWQPSII